MRSEPRREEGRLLQIITNYLLTSEFVKMGRKSLGVYAHENSPPTPPWCRVAPSSMNSCKIDESFCGNMPLCVVNEWV